MDNPANDKLKELFGHIAEKIATLSPHEDNFIFSSETLPIPPPYLETDKLRIQNFKHEYDSYYRVDALWFLAEREIYRYLGLLTLAVVFHKSPAKVELKLTHPLSDIKSLVIEFEYKDYDKIYPGYSSRPYAFKYYSSEISNHPWINENLSLHDLPRFYLTNLIEEVYSEDDWNIRDTVLGFGNDSGSVLFAELLLNFSHPKNQMLEIELECEAGFRGVGKESAEVRIGIPGSLSTL